MNVDIVKSCHSFDEGLMDMINIVISNVLSDLFMSNDLFFAEPPKTYEVEKHPEFVGSGKYDEGKFINWYILLL